MLKYRLISGPILIVVLLGLTWLDEWFGRRWGVPGVAYLFLLLLVMPLMANELTIIFRRTGAHAQRWLTTIAAATGLAAMALAVSMEQPDARFSIDVNGAAMLGVAFFAVYCAGLVAFTRGQQTQGVIVSTACLLFAMLYLGVMPGFYFLIRAEHSAWWIVGLLMIIKMADTGAYTVGHAIGKHKLIPWLSPGKTREGFVGGIAAAAVVGVVVALLSQTLPSADDHVDWWLGGIWGFVLGIAGQAGDLAMSLAKRDAGIKDSSNVIPGLGGLLDVLDSPLFVAPIAYILIALTH